jgi:hypothetical protein
MKNFRKSILVMLLLLSVMLVKAQGGSKREKMEALKVAFITEKLDLSSAEAKAFWPVYNEFHKKRKAISKGMGKPRPDGPPPPGEKRPKEPNFDEMTDAQISDFIDARHQQEQKMLDLHVEYMTKYKAVLPIRKIGKLLHAEKDFRKEVLKKMRENHR